MSVSNDVCKVCLEEKQDLVVPCKCTKGSHRFVCLNCANQMFGKSYAQCDYCKYNFKYNSILKGIQFNWGNMKTDFESMLNPSLVIKIAYNIGFQFGMWWPHFVICLFCCYFHCINTLNWWSMIAWGIRLSMFKQTMKHFLNLIQNIFITRPSREPLIFFHLLTPWIAIAQDIIIVLFKFLMLNDLSWMKEMCWIIVLFGLEIYRYQYIIFKLNEKKTMVLLTCIITTISQYFLIIVAMESSLSIVIALNLIVLTIRFLNSKRNYYFVHQEHEIQPYSASSNE
jgi:hypothetical protein